MRDRHFPRLCRSCRARIARQENACRRCGTNWATEDEPTATLLLVSAGARADVASAPDAGISTTPAGRDSAAALARLDTDRWIDEGGTLGSEAAPSLPATRGSSRPLTGSRGWRKASSRRPPSRPARRRQSS
jgi:hypothetical protein